MTAHITNTCFNVAAAATARKMKKMKKMKDRNASGASGSEHRADRHVSSLVAKQVLDFDESKFVRTFSELPTMLAEERSGINNGDGGGGLRSSARDADPAATGISTGVSSGVSPLHLAAGAKDASLLYGRMRGAVTRFFESFRGETGGFMPLPNGFELFGIDFLVDQDMNPWLLEFNPGPDLKQTGGRLQPFMQQMVKEMLDVALWDRNLDDPGKRTREQIRRFEAARHSKARSQAPKSSSSSSSSGSCSGGRRDSASDSAGVPDDLVGVAAPQLVPSTSASSVDARALLLLNAQIQAGTGTGTGTEIETMQASCDSGLILPGSASIEKHAGWSAWWEVAHSAKIPSTAETSPRGAFEARPVGATNGWDLVYSQEGGSGTQGGSSMTVTG